MKRALLACALFVACKADHPKATDPSVLLSDDPSEIVATVDDRPIHASDVAAEMKASGKDRKAALDALVDAEVLAGLAVKRGLYHDDDVTQARRAAEGRRLLQTDFEPRTSINRIPDDDLRRAYDVNRTYYDHDEIAEVQHIVASVPQGSPASQLEQAHSEIAALVPKAKLVTTPEQFAALADANAPVPTHVEQLGFPRHDSVEEPFAEAAFALTKPGQISPPVLTRYGWHVIRLVQRSPGRHVAIAEAEKELREGTFGPWRKHQLELYIQGLLERYNAVENKDKVPPAHE